MPLDGGAHIAYLSNVRLNLGFHFQRPAMSLRAIKPQHETRTRLLDAAEADGRRAFLPSTSLCTDNGAMIAAAAWWRLRSDGPTPLSGGAYPGLRLPTIDGA